MLGRVLTTDNGQPTTDKGHIMIEELQKEFDELKQRAADLRSFL